MSFDALFEGFSTEAIAAMIGLAVGPDRKSVV